ncbi:TraX family protein [Mycobacterium tuberculosis]
MCAYNGNAWALLAIPAMRLAHFNVAVPRSGKIFYGYYIGHLVALLLIAAILV